MRVIKGAAAAVLILVLLATAGLTMGLQAAGKALSADSIQRVMTDTTIVEDLVDDALQSGTVDVSGVYGDITQDVLQSDVMAEYLSGYLSAVIGSELMGEDFEGEGYGTESEAYDDLLNAFSQELTEISGSEEYNIPSLDEGYVQQMLESESADITAGLDEQLEGYELFAEDTFIGALMANGMLQALAGSGMRTLLTILAVIAGIGIVALCWRSKLGFLWCALCMGLLSIFYGTVSLMGETIIAFMGASAAEGMMLTILMEGLGASAKTGLLITVALLAVFIIFKVIDRRRNNRYEENFKTSKRFA